MTILSFWMDRTSCMAVIKEEEKAQAFFEKLPEGMSQSAFLVPFLQSVIAGQALDGIIAPCGPASFTTVRLILATAQGLALAYSKAQCFAPTHFEVYAAAARATTEGPLLILLDTYTNAFFTQRISSDNSVETLGVKEIETICEWLAAEPSLVIVTDVPEKFTAWQERVWHENVNLACVQLTLFERLNPPSGAFLPYYVHTPEYKQKS